MAIKNQAKVKKARVSEVGKRFSKAKMKHDTTSDTVTASREEIKKQRNPVVKPRKPVLDNSPVKIQFKGKPLSTYTVILTSPSLQRYGYDVISAGQQVTIECFQPFDEYVRVKTMDGRVGITRVGAWKTLKFS